MDRDTFILIFFIVGVFVISAGIWNEEKLISFEERLQNRLRACKLRVSARFAK